MKSYKKVEMVAKNAPSGSYAAGCPQHTRYGTDYTKEDYVTSGGTHATRFGNCSMCEVAS